MGACCAEVMAADVTTNIRGVLDKAVLAEEVEEEGNTCRLKERKEGKNANTRGILAIPVGLPFHPS
jgi:hypothetical protein